MADSEWFILKRKPIIYIRAFIELYNKKNSGPLYEIQKMVRFKKIYALTTKNSYNLGNYWMVEISHILHIAYIVLENYNKFVFYVNKYIDCDQLSQLYDSN